MIKKVKKRAKPIRTCEGGVWRVPKAFLKKEKTTIILVKEVNRTKILGAKARTVMIRSISRVTTRSLSLSGGATPMEMDGNGISS